MALTFTAKPLGDGQLAATKTTLYTVPASTRTIVKLITLVNTDSSARTVNLYLNLSGTSRRIIEKDKSLAAGAALEVPLREGIYTLDTGDLIEGDASAASVVDYTIHGVEET